MGTVNGILGHWHALIEENTGGGGQYANWRVNRTVDLGPDRDTAYAAAARLAVTYKPRHPSQDRGRQIFEHGPDAWVVIVQGAMSVHHFRLSLVKLAAQT